MFELVTNRFVTVEKEFPTLRDALTEAKVVLERIPWVEHVWIRKTYGILMLCRVTRKKTYFLDPFELPTESV